MSAFKLTPDIWSARYALAVIEARVDERTPTRRERRELVKRRITLRAAYRRYPLDAWCCGEVKPCQP